MSHARAVRRALIALAAAGALAISVGCTAGPAPSASVTASAPSANWDELGPIVYAQGKDTSGTVKAQVAEWNKANPNEQVELRELSESTDEQRDAMVERAKNKSGEFAVMAIDVPSWQARDKLTSYPDAAVADICANYARGIVKACTENKTATRARVNGIRCGLLPKNKEDAEAEIRVANKQVIVMLGTLNSSMVDSGNKVYSVLKARK